VKLTAQLPSSGKVKNVWTCTSIHPYVLKAWCLIKCSYCITFLCFLTYSLENISVKVQDIEQFISYKAGC